MFDGNKTIVLVQIKHFLSFQLLCYLSALAFFLRHSSGQLSMTSQDPLATISRRDTRPKAGCFHSFLSLRVQCVAERFFSRSLHAHITMFWAFLQSERIKHVMVTFSWHWQTTRNAWRWKKIMYCKVFYKYLTMCQIKKNNKVLQNSNDLCNSCIIQMS